jgi:hypothetical protein
MPEAIACLAESRRRAARAARALSVRMPGVPFHPHSLSSYLAARDAPGRIVVCADGGAPRDQIGLLRRLAARLLWPGPPADFRDAIGGLRTHGARPRAAAPSRGAPRGRRIAAALLLEGKVDAARAIAALAAGAPRDWIVESARQVRFGGGLMSELTRRGIRWSALEPIELVALYATPALARQRTRWRGLVPAKTAVWLKERRPSR